MISDRVAGIHQPLQHLDQLVHVGGVQAHGRLIQHVERAPGGPAGELLRQLDPLRFAAGEGRGRLPDADVAQPHFLQEFQLVVHGG